jgi:hypothetical protein
MQISELIDSILKQKAKEKNVGLTEYITWLGYQANVSPRQIGRIRTQINDFPTREIIDKLSKILPEFLLFNPRSLVNRLLLPFDAISNNKVSQLYIISTNNPTSQLIDLVSYYLTKADIIKIYCHEIYQDYILPIREELYVKSIQQVSKSGNFSKQDIDNISQKIASLEFTLYQPSCNAYRQFGASVTIFIDNKGQKYGVREFRGARLSNIEVEAGGYLYIDDKDLDLFCKDLNLKVVN